MRPWNLGDISYTEVKSAAFEVAILPLGATEPHNLHLPYGTDTLEVAAVADEAARRASSRGARVVVLPPLPYGTETNLRRFPLAMNLDPTTVAAVVTDLVGSLESSGIRKCLLLNGHGGNDLKWLLRQLHGRTSVHLFLSNWYTVASDLHPELFTDAGDHAGELETSMGLAFFPELVRLERANDGATRPTRFEAVNRGWVTLTRPWHLLTTETGAGDPRPATAEKGRALMDVIADRLAGFLVELSEARVDDAFPF